MDVQDDNQNVEIAADVVSRIEAAAAGVIDLHYLVRNLGLIEEERNGVLGQLSAAFDYHEPFSGEAAAGADYFGPLYEIDGGRYPPELSAVPDDVVRIWVAAADAVEAPIAHARLNDLCFEAGWGNRGDRARKAFDSHLAAADQLSAYSEGADRAQATFTRLQHLRRALTLARRVSDTSRAETAVRCILDEAEESFAQAALEPGITLGLVEILIEDKTHPDDVAMLLERARTLYAGDFHNTAATIDLQLRRTDLEEADRTVLHRELVTNRLDQAEAEEPGLLRLHHLEAAAQLAHRYHQEDLLAEATSRLQQIGIDDIELTAHSFEVKIPEEQIEAHFAQFTDQPAWRDALLRTIAFGPPSGQLDENREQVAAHARIAPLSSIFPHVQLGDDGLPRFTASSDEEMEDQRLVSYEMLRAQVSGMLLQETLTRIWAKWGPIPADELGTFLSEAAHVDSGLGAALARDFLRFFNGDPEGAAYSVTPHIETLVRDIVLAIPLPIFRVQRPRNPGQYPGVGTLLPALRAHGLDESWARFLEGFLTKPMGPNVRNELLHGFLLDPTPTSAALLLISALYLARGVVLTPRPVTEAIGQV